MQENIANTIWKCAIYARLSREEIEGNSMESQKCMLTQRIQKDPQMLLAGIWEDDGYSGIHYNRPGFLSMMKAVEEGSVNCILVKDLSRLGRDYIETGRLLQLVFPSLKVRFLAVNDQYDSLYSEANERDLLLPIRNFVNDSYCRDISMKVRSHQEVKRQNGEFIGAFPVYGYLKSPENHNQLIPDPDTQPVVQWIYQSYLNGRSARNIADSLNKKAIPSPLGQKKLQGMAFHTSFAGSEIPRWSAQAVLRVLSNRVYTGVLQQGKSVKINYKIDQRRRKPENEWITRKETHPPVIPPFTYEVVQDKRCHRGIYCTGLLKPKIKKWMQDLSIWLIENAARFPETKADYSTQLMKLQDLYQHDGMEQRGSSMLQDMLKYQNYLQNEKVRWERLLLMCYQDYKANVISSLDYQILRKGYTQNLEQMQSAIHALNAECKEESSQDYKFTQKPEAKGMDNISGSDLKKQISSHHQEQPAAYAKPCDILLSHSLNPLLWAYLFCDVTEADSKHYIVKCRFRQP